MWRTSEVILWAVWIILDCAMISASLPEITDKKFIDECVSEHNRARSSVTPAATDMLYMTWDENLAAAARKWASECLFEHNPHLQEGHVLNRDFSFVGENIWIGHPPSSFNVAEAIKKWMDEKQDYDYNSNTCTKVCGHYTQVVWARSNKVGCAAWLCPNGVRKSSFSDKEGSIFVCNYAPAGNINQQKPYKSEGPACSGCDGLCVQNLCRDKSLSGREDSQDDNWTPDRKPDSNYVVILIVRPIALISTFIAAYAVHHFYPNIFCYE